MDEGGLSGAADADDALGRLRRDGLGLRIGPVALEPEAGRSSCGSAAWGKSTPTVTLKSSIDVPFRGGRQASLTSSVALKLLCDWERPNQRCRGAPFDEAGGGTMILKAGHESYGRIAQLCAAVKYTGARKATNVMSVTTQIPPREAS